MLRFVALVLLLLALLPAHLRAEVGGPAGHAVHCASAGAPATEAATAATAHADAAARSAPPAAVDVASSAAPTCPHHGTPSCPMSGGACCVTALAAAAADPARPRLGDAPVGARRPADRAISRALATPDRPPRPLA